MSKRIQPTWNSVVTKTEPKLKLYNSLTRQKEIFVPLNDRNVTWYCCGPTVYDASHMGHARSYISFDILRRVLSNYFGFNVHYVMNITDIDDKIIKRARQSYLFDKYKKKVQNLSINKLLEDHNLILDMLEATYSKNTDSNRQIMLDKLMICLKNVRIIITKAMSSGNKHDIDQARTTYLHEAKESIMQWLDEKEGITINDNTIFENLPQYWEDQFHIDMENLNILPPDVLTRVSEYIPKIISFIERIIENGLAYIVNGSVYFNVTAFDSRPKHFYAKLMPEAYGDTKCLQEGEGDLFLNEKLLTEKLSLNDFALWKASKEGEPFWDSPWGRGRPGWHIECSAMASDVLGTMIDIHTGGVDLKFPHHDNELAQSEAAFDQSEWVKYFLHTGHLTIAGCKMSKSLKNFVTIQEALRKHTSCQLRLAFLLHSWRETIDYSDNTMEMAIQYERFLNEFFLNVKDLIRNASFQKPRLQYMCWSKEEQILLEKYNTTRYLVHKALCDNVDTRTTLDVIKDMVTSANIYIRDKKILNTLLLKKVAVYITDLFNMFGVITGPKGIIGFPSSGYIQNEQDNTENIILPYINTMAEFRNRIRNYGKINKCLDILKLCDELRDDILPQIGVRLEDKESGVFAVKLVNRDILLESKKFTKVDRKKQIYDKKQVLIKTSEVKEKQEKINPKEMFLNLTDKYSSFDSNGLPTHDKDGKEISKGHLKKLKKIQYQQEQRYAKCNIKVDIDNKI